MQQLLVFFIFDLVYCIQKAIQTLSYDLLLFKDKQVYTVLVFLTNTNSWLCVSRLGTGYVDAVQCLTAKLLLVDTHDVILLVNRIVGICKLIITD